MKNGRKNLVAFLQHGEEQNCGKCHEHGLRHLGRERHRSQDRYDQEVDVGDAQKLKQQAFWEPCQEVVPKILEFKARKILREMTWWC